MMPAAFDLNLRHLLGVAAAVDHGTLSAAAGRVGLSQPALTQGLTKLERLLARPLFVRTSIGLEPTAAGREMAARVTGAFAHLAAAARSIAGGRGFTRPERLMTATQLGAFLRVVDAGGYLEASVSGDLSQPALHRAVRDLEGVLGIALFERRGRGVVQTDAGRRFARGVRLAEREIAAGIAELSADPAGAGRIVIGAMPLSRARVLPTALARFTTEAPGVRVEIVEGSWRELVEPLRDGRLDLMVGALRAEAPAGIVQQPLFTDWLAVIARADHPLAGETAPSATALARYPWVVGSTDSPLADAWRRLFGAGPVPRAPIACGSVMVIRGLLRDSDLLTLLSPDQVALEIDAGLLTTIGPPLEASVRRIGLSHRADWRPTALQRHLTALLEEAASDRSYQESE